MVHVRRTRTATARCLVAQVSILVLTRIVPQSTSFTLSISTQRKRCFPTYKYRHKYEQLQGKRPRPEIFLSMVSTENDVESVATSLTNISVASPPQSAASSEDDDDEENCFEAHSDNETDEEEEEEEATKQNKKKSDDVPSSLEESTRTLLCNSSPVGQWTWDDFQQAHAAMYAWALRQSRRSALTVERLIRRVVEEQMAGNPHSQSVNLSAMYTAAVQAWANSWQTGAAVRAEQILENMLRQYQEQGETSIRPTVETFNWVLLAYIRSGLPDAPQQAVRVLERWIDWYSQGVTTVIPNKESYATILKGYAKVGGPEAPSLVLRLIEHLEQLASQDGYPSVRPDYQCHNTYIGALTNSITRRHISGEEAAIKAEKYLYEVMMTSPNEDAHPDTWTFNMVLTAWSRSGSSEMARRAEALVEELERYHAASGYSEKTQPNTNTYNCLIACYGRSAIKDKGKLAHTVLRRIVALNKSGNNTLAKPDAVTYNSVMNAISKSRTKEAPYKVEELLREMHQVYEGTGDSRVCPNSRSFNTCVDAWARSTAPGAAARIMDWIVYMQGNAQKLGRKELRPNKITYNLFLQALAKSGEPNIGEEAEQVLNQMISFHKRGWTSLKPDVLTFTNVIHCIALSGKEDAVERSMAILRKMEDLHEKGYGDVRPNTYTYNCVINAAAKSKRSGKAQIARQILRRMKDVALRPKTVTYNNVLNACGFAGYPGDDPDEIVNIASEIFEEAKATSGCNYISYATYLRVVGNFVRDGTKRFRMTRDIVRQGCEAGQLNRFVMMQARHAVTPAQYVELKKETSDENGQLRQEYTVNARKTKAAFSTKNIFAVND